MSIDKRDSTNLDVFSGKLDFGVYVGRITSVLDTLYMGRLEVAIIGPGVPGNDDSKAEVITVHYVSPFYGVSSIKFEGANPGNYEDVQKSYGFWMIPPDIGTKVLVIKAKGFSHGWWIGCIQDEYQNHMVPGIAASSNVIVSNEQALKYGTTYLPVAEFSKTTDKKGSLDPNKQLKPVHPFADRLLAQGLLLDNIRGVTSSNARRETPSAVFGISTPGPLDPNGKKVPIGYKGAKFNVPITRLGGTQFVMDDGDIFGENELVRLRTRTGHQILLHNSSDLIYIANAAGTAWIEMTGNGKIDIYAADSVSIHSEADFNFRADRDINLEAGRNINLKSIQDTHIETVNDFSILVTGDGKISVKGNFDKMVNQDYKLSVTKDINLATGGIARLSAEDGIDLLSEGSIKQSTGGSFHFGSTGDFFVTGNEIHLNGPAAESATAAKLASTVQPLEVFSLPNRSTESGWANGNCYYAGTIDSFMQRVPTHEPWDQHENINFYKFNSEATDIKVAVTNAAKEKKVSVSNPQTNTAPTSQIPVDWTKDEPFIEKIKEISNKFGCQPVDLLACMAFETGETFSPSKKNKSNGATGLIQFTDTTATGLGTSLNNLAAMTRAQQCEWVDKALSQTKLSKIKNPPISDLYMAILRPIAIGTSNDQILFSAGSKAYSGNANLDVDKKGYVTKSDATAKVIAKIPYVNSQLKKAGITL